MKFFQKRAERILEEARRRQVAIELSDRISKEQEQIAGIADEQMKNQCEGIKALAEAEKALAEVDLEKQKIKNEHTRGLIGICVGALKAAASVAVIWTVYGLESNKGWFLSNKESGRLASDAMRESLREDKRP